MSGDRAFHLPPSLRTNSASHWPIAATPLCLPSHNTTFPTPRQSQLYNNKMDAADVSPQYKCRLSLNSKLSHPYVP